MQKFKFNINGKSYEAIVETERNTARVGLNGKSYTVQVEGGGCIVSPKIAPLSPPASGSDFVDAPAQPITGNAGSIRAPLPDNVLRLKLRRVRPLRLAGSYDLGGNEDGERDYGSQYARYHVKKIYVSEGRPYSRVRALIDLE